MLNGQSVTYGMTLSPEELLDWWPTAQQSFTSHARTLQTEAKIKRTTATSSLPAAQAAYTAALRQVETTTPSNFPTASAAAAAARSSFHSLCRQSSDPVARSLQHTWNAA